VDEFEIGYGTVGNSRQ